MGEGVWKICIMKVCFIFLDYLIFDVGWDYANNNLGEGHFDDGSNRPSGAATPIPGDESAVGGKGKKGKKVGKKAKTAKQRLAMADGDVDMG